MKRLFLVRHGNYNSEGLTDDGREQVTRLAESIRPLAIGTSYVMSSPIKRALQSAEIVARALGIADIEQVPFFHQDEFYHRVPGHLEKAMQIVTERAGMVDNLVVVAHLPLVEDFTPYFAKSSETPFEFYATPRKGEGYCVDIEEKKTTRLPE